MSIERSRQEPSVGSYTTDNRHLVVFWPERKTEGKMIHGLPDTIEELRYRLFCGNSLWAIDKPSPDIDPPPKKEPRPIRREYRPKAVRRRYIKLNKQLIANFKANGCRNCHYNDNPSSIDAHHVDPSTKEHLVSTMINSSTPKQLERELAKCIPLCANCHRLLHIKKRRTNQDTTRET